MRPAARYPVDRYLVERSNNMNIIEIMDDDLWKPEPALRPEDECLLRNLHDMLQLTADDLKVLSGELSKYHEAGVAAKALPTPLDDDFNEKLHIEEVVNAKFHPNITLSQKSARSVQDLIASEVRKHKSLSDSRKAQTPVQKKHLQISRTRVVHIPECANVLDGKPIDVRNKPSNDKAVLYNEIVYQEAEKQVSEKPFRIQEMPSISIRGELRRQNVVNLDILPNSPVELGGPSPTHNICVISVNHDGPAANKNVHRVDVDFEPASVRKVSKMSSYDSSESSPPMASKPKHVTPRFAQKHLKNQSTSQSAKEESNLNDWKRKLRAVYEQSGERKSHVKFKKSSNSQALGKTILNNSEYIPYAKLTLGGVRVKDIEREISHASHKKDLPLSPVLDKTLSQSSFGDGPAQRHADKSGSRVLTASDEHLLREVLDIEERVSVTLSKNNRNVDRSRSTSNEDNTYADDFEVDNSNGLSLSANLEHHLRNRPLEKISNLSLKNQIETFEFIHTVDTHEHATQSSTAATICPKGTQTSPRNDLSVVEDMFRVEKAFIKKVIIDEYSDLLVSLEKPSTASDNRDNRTTPPAQKSTQTCPARAKSAMTSPFVSLADKQTSPLAGEAAAPSESSAGLGDITVNLSSPRFQLQLPKSASTARQPRLVSSSSSSVEDYASSDMSFGEISKFERRLRRHKVSSASDSSSGRSVGPMRSEGELGCCQPESNRCSKSEGEVSLGQLR